MTDVDLAPISGADLPAVAAFMAQEMGSGVSAQAWIEALTMPWSRGPNHGFMLTENGAVVGAYLAIYSEQPVAGRTEPFCNLAAWGVREEHRAASLRLVRALLGQRGYHVTDFSPSGNVPALNRRLRFVDLDTTTVLAPNLPRPSRTRVVDDLDRIEATLGGRDLEIFRDHRTAAGCTHLLLQRGSEHCYVVVRRERRKGRPWFASLLHVGHPDVLARGWAALQTHLLRRGMPVTLVELRVTGSAPRLSFTQRSPRPKMYRSPTLAADEVGYMYSELACLAW